ncbi:hypothetical protein [Roseofilum sp. Belize Diploria]|uniref:hypothetical protein n=1 Tax=Roseofilum sp. Belize Diploria TaxID=2821501 RepID=UPI001B06BE86|nr:hypothetical protein [Roseofilum sp. Belize Diploria]MBP0010519.1 hypothetical protein [Roseofilum sp. Belize Diploria]
MPCSIRRKKIAQQSSAPQQSSSRFVPKVLLSVQRKESQEQSLAQFKPASHYQYNSLNEIYGHSAPVQTKLTIGKPGDVHRKQADTVAHQGFTHLNQPEPQPRQDIQKKENIAPDLQQQEQSASEQEGDSSPSRTLAAIQDLNPVSSTSENTIQRAIGLEIEVPVPVDKMSTTNMAKLRNWTAAEFGNSKENDLKAKFRNVGETYTLEDLKEDYPNEVTYFLTLSETQQQEYLEKKKSNKKMVNSLKWVANMSKEHKKTFLELGSEEATDSKGLNKKGAVYGRVDYTRGNYSAYKPSVEEFGKVSGAIAAGSKFVAQVDHNPRVNSGKKPPNHPWRDSNNSALMEIVMDPPANNKDEFDESISQITQFVNTINQKTSNLTKHAQNPFRTNFNLGPFDYPEISQFASLPKEPTHNWKGSVQVNVGIDLREYSDMASWYAQSKYSSTNVNENPEAAGLSEEEKEAYNASRNNIIRAVEIAEEIIPELKKSLSKFQKTRESKFAEMGNMRGLKGWITHLALHMLGAISFSGGSTTKNITPILMKTPNTITLKFGFTEAEKTYYDVIGNKKKILKLLIQKTGREKKLTWTGYQGDLKTGNKEILSENNKLIPGGNTSLGTFASKDTTQTLTGNSVTSERHLGVGPIRRGNKSVSKMESVGQDQRGGAVIEFRQLPGLYDGPNAWKQIGYDFLKEAEARNRRGGLSDDSLDDLVGPEWKEDTISSSSHREAITGKE